ncbi:Zinc finger protein GLI1, partial [Dissostichus eleginoides]
RRAMETSFSLSLLLCSPPPNSLWARTAPPAHQTSNKCGYRPIKNKGRGEKKNEGLAASFIAHIYTFLRARRGAGWTDELAVSERGRPPRAWDLSLIPHSSSLL